LSGEVVDAGALVTNFAVGDRVAGPTEGVAGLAELALVADKLASALPEGLDRSLAALAAPGALALAGMRAAGVGAGDCAVVIGSAPLGLLALQSLMGTGASCSVVGGRAAGRAMAAEFGAEQVFEWRGTEVESMLAARPLGGADVVIDAVGRPGSLQRAVHLLRPGGRLILLKGCTQEDSLLLGMLIVKELELRTCSFAAWLQERALAAMAEGRLRAESIVSRTVDFDELEDAARLLLQGEASAEVSVVLTPSG
jgi:threonine dehydrogenase-like Zn-dependent dehydrogenase